MLSESDTHALRPVRVPLELPKNVRDGTRQPARRRCHNAGHLGRTLVFLCDHGAAAGRPRGSRHSWTLAVLAIVLRFPRGLRPRSVAPAAVTASSWRCHNLVKSITLIDRARQ